ncbi:sulfite exporter TauE/SafE family protein [Streptomyces sp. NPDC056121]|uniref:sulfite exporter TauE/SafE family protein n=1 Tax=unclassified Streptomyces TaxID=2593676 RepID=UPI0022512B71|nr:sulfite exporter TauE/SafE family protein [Streptomyces sp. NBC_00401]MCX5087291.1 sulfite exporter TauE/SafE family protein [Streptomyces sp. NBC_00401]
MSVLILALVAGAVVGLALGGLGGGGSVLAVPALIYLLGFTPVAATTASLIIVTLTSISSLAAHARDGNVRWRSGLLFAAAGIGPAMLGGLAAGHIPATALTIAFSVIAALAAWRMLRPGRPAQDGPVQGSPAEGDAVRDSPAEDRPVRPPRAAGSGAGLGAVTGVLGVGGGFLAVPALVGVLGLRMKTAVGTSLLVIVINSLAALATRTGTADGLDWAVIAPFTAAAILGAWDGKRLAAKISGNRLQHVFAYVLLAVAAFMLLDSLI